MSDSESFSNILRKTVDKNFLFLLIFISTKPFLLIVISSQAPIYGLISALYKVNPVVLSISAVK